MFNSQLRDKNIEKMLYNLTFKDLYNFLQKEKKENYPDFNMETFKDKNGNNMLHIFSKKIIFDNNKYQWSKTFLDLSIKDMDEINCSFFLKEELIYLGKIINEYKKFKDLNIKNKNGNNVFILSLISGNFDLFKFLLKYDVKLDVLDNEGNNLLYLSSYGGNLNIVKYIVETIYQNKIDLEKLNNNLETPVFGAVKNNNLEILQYLYLKGAKINIRNNEGKSLIYIANQRNYQNMEKYLKDNIKNS